MVSFKKNFTQINISKCIALRIQMSLGHFWIIEIVNYIYYIVQYPIGKYVTTLIHDFIIQKSSNGYFLGEKTFLKSSTNLKQNHLSTSTNQNRDFISYRKYVIQLKIYFFSFLRMIICYAFLRINNLMMASLFFFRYEWGKNTFMQFVDFNP